ncbi:MAG: hypothetical protein DRO40_10120 [Thermoprotei archaeon]|nr:MAG: hypothetical protein DRO40_10120 [Thermoprotei archaeon]
MIYLRRNAIKGIFVYYGSSDSKLRGSDVIQYKISKKYNCKIIPLSSLSFMNKFIDKLIIKGKKDNKINSTIISKFRWILINIIWIMQHYFMHPLFLDRKMIKRINNYDIMILGSILGASFIKKVIKKPKLIVLDHNVSWLFTYYNLERLFLIRRILVTLIRKIEIEAINAADEVWVLTEHDAKILRKDADNPNKIMIFPISDLLEIYDSQKINIITERSKTLDIYRRLKGKFIIGFIGSLFKPNIIAVRNIIKIASRLPNNVIFLIIGSVSEAFKNVRVPPNIIFAGYVKDLDAYLALCDAFINPKTTSDTGMEVKMLDYLKFDKPVISTDVGARGFENFKNVIIVPIDKMTKVISELCKHKQYNG